MDKSRHYIQMCKTSKEIQTAWEQTPGDFYADMNNNVNCWTFANGETARMKDGFKIVSNNYIVRIEKLFWLPRVNQLIELAQCQNKAFCDISFRFLDWIKTPYLNDAPADKCFKSIEQLWLAYIMNSRFLKKWADDKWQMISYR